MLRYINLVFNILGIDIIKLYRTIRGFPAYLFDYFLFFRSRPKQNNNFKMGKIYPILDNKNSSNNATKSQYYIQDLLIANKIFNNNPIRHIDVGSRLDGFVAHVASFRTIEVIDIVKVEGFTPNINFIYGDLTKELPNNLIESCDSLSCLHALEHFGLGRYGDPIDWDGYIIGFNNLFKILKSNGKLYFSVPIGKQRIEFNAHRIFSVDYLIKMFEEKFLIDSFSYIDDSGKLFENASINSPDIKNNFGCKYGCGIFELIKI